MTVIVTIDDRHGVSFAGRRQSRDAKLNERILQYAKEHQMPLMAREQTTKLFSQQDSILLAGDKDLAKKQAIFFAECDSLSELETDIDIIVVAKWNRIYPCDRYLSFDPTISPEWTMTHIEEFKGSSHDKITFAEFKRKKGS